MRQLNITTRPSSYNEAATAAAWELLRSLPLPPDLPAFTHPAFSATGRRFILSLAQQHSIQSLSHMVQVGFEAAIAAAWHYREQPELWARFGAWWVREEIIEAQSGISQ